MNVPETMKRATAMLAVGLLAACATADESGVDTTTEPGARGEAVRDTMVEDEGMMEDDDMTTEEFTWEARLAANEGFDVTGVTNARDLPNAETRTAIEVRGGSAGATHPWHIHEGACGSGGPIVGQASAYPPVTIGSGGEGTASATIDVRLDPDSDYYVNVHKSPSEVGAIAACGELRQN